MNTSGEQRSQHWHLDKRVSITQIVAIVGVIVGGVTAWTNLDNRVNNNALQIAEMKQGRQRDTERIDTRLQQVVEKIEDSNRELAEKVDALKDYLLRQAREDARNGR